MMMNLNYIKVDVIKSTMNTGLSNIILKNLGHSISLLKFLTQVLKQKDKTCVITIKKILWDMRIDEENITQVISKINDKNIKVCIIRSPSLASRKKLSGLNKLVTLEEGMKDEDYHKIVL